MRNRPKQVNYLAKFGQERTGAVPASGGTNAAGRPDAIRSADRIIDRNANGVKMVPKKPAGPSKLAAGGRNALQQGRGGVQNTPSVQDQNIPAGGKIAQFRSLDDMPNGYDDENSFEPPSRGAADAQGGLGLRLGGGGGGNRASSLLEEDGADFWEAAKPVPKRQQAHQRAATPDDAARHFGRTGAEEEDFWGMGVGAGPIPKPVSAGSSSRAHAGGYQGNNNGGNGNGGWGGANDGYSPPKPGHDSSGQGQGLVLRDDGLFNNGGGGHQRHVQQPHVKPHEGRRRQEPARRNGEYSPEHIPAAAASPRQHKPAAQNVIPRMSSFRPMQPDNGGNGNNGDEYYADDIESPRFHQQQQYQQQQQPQHHQHHHQQQQQQQQQRNPYQRQANVQDPVSTVSEDHGFSPPRKINNPGKNPFPAAAAPRHNFGDEDVRNLELVGKVQVQKKVVPPPLPAMLNRKFEEDDDDEWADPVSGRSDRRSARSAGRGGDSPRGGGQRYHSPIRDQGPSMEYDDDSVEGSPRQYGYGKQQPKQGQHSPRTNKNHGGGGANAGIPLVRIVHGADNFRSKFHPDGEAKPKVGRIQNGPHVRKGAPQLASPRASFDSVDAPPLPFEARRAKAAASASQENLPENEKLHYSKAPRKVEYKPYSLKDYKEIKHDTYVIVPAKLQPDLNSDVLVAKRANQQRIKEFSKQLKDFNRAEIRQHAAGKDGGEAGEKGQALSKRDKALQYGKQVRSKVAANQEAEREAAKQAQMIANKRRVDPFSEDDWAGNQTNYDDDYVQAPDPTGQAYEKARQIEELDSKHNDAKRQIDAIKRALKI